MSTRDGLHRAIGHGFSQIGAVEGSMAIEGLLKETIQHFLEFR
ncbi:MAG: hypothetical protein WBC73_06515 [Phormidesmis sp.]